MSVHALPIAIFFSAAASLGVELAIVRLGAPYVGQSLLPWSAAIASVLLGLAAGHALGGVVAQRHDDAARLRLRLALAWLAAACFAAQMPFFAPRVVDALLVDGTSSEAAILALAALAAPPAMAVGFVAPIAVRLVTLTQTAHTARVVSAIYSASAAGSVAGAAVSGFLILETLGAAGLTACVCAVWLALGACALPWRAQQPGVTAAAAAGILLCVAMTGMLLAGAPSPCQHETRYTCIRLFDRPLESGGLLRFMILDEGVHSASDQHSPTALHLGYAALVDRLAQHAFHQAPPQREPRAMVVGGGGATLPRSWASHDAQRPAAVLSVELDPTVAAIASRDMWAAGIPRLASVTGDGRAVMRSLAPDATFDAILMDAYRTHSVPPHLVTAEFAAEVANRLPPTGVYLSNIIDRGAEPALALSVARTLRQHFPAVDIWTLMDQTDGATNYAVAAWKEAHAALRPVQLTSTASIMDAGAAVTQRTVQWRRIDYDAYRAQWPKACPVTLTDDWAPVDRLLAGRVHCRGDRG